MRGKKISYPEFPSPLEEEIKNKYIYLLFNGDDEARKEAREKLIIHNTRLVMHIAGKYMKSGAEFEELVSHGFIGLIKGVDTFAVNKKTKLSKCLVKCVENEILMLLRKNKNNKFCIRLDDSIDRNDANKHKIGFKDVISTDIGFEDKIIDELFIKEYLPLIINELSEKEKKIIYFRYGFINNKPISQEKLASILGISQGFISRIEKRALQKLRKKILHYIEDRNFDVIKEKRKKNKDYIGKRE